MPRASGWVIVPTLLAGWCIGLAQNSTLIAEDATGEKPEASATPSAEGLEFYEKRIRPVLVEQCYSCHSTNAKKLRGGLRLDLSQAIRKGGDSGAVVVAGKPDESPLIEAISYEGLVSEMPPSGKLPENVLADFRKWVEIGSPLPVDEAAPDNQPQKSVNFETGRQFWSFQPVSKHELPETSNPNWPRQRIDHFVLKQLDDHGMPPAAEADRRTWLRRVTTDLTGLPPTYAEIEAYVADTAPDADAQAVERLLSSPQYGERWARHWLDVARYAEDNPTSETTCQPPRFPYQYRDWVIRVFNDDLPYNEFVRRQLAADLLDLPPEETAALGYLGLSPVYHKEPKLSKDVISVIISDEWDERLDTITRGFLGLTVACARCHDHKFDPITTKDYYALAGVIASTQLVEWPLVETDLETASALTDTQLLIVDETLRLDYANKMKKTALAKGEEEVDPEEVAAFEQTASEIDAKLKMLKEKKLFEGPIANAVRDAGLWINGDDPDWTLLDFKPGVPRDLPVFIRGSATNPGEIVPRRFLEVFSPNGLKPYQHGSGRLELADNIVNEAAPLSARVIVNRIWGRHFGQPLVRTPSNFGKLGDRPSHPELLDDLTARFIENGWSLKWLHREIVLSATYRQASVHETGYHETDPDNRQLWRMNRRRLEPEAWRDSVLGISGDLDLSMQGTSEDLNKVESHRRTVYGTVSRQKPADLFRLFDFPDAKAHSAQRLLTTTPLQQLYLLNSPFLQQHAATLVKSVRTAPEAPPQETVQSLFQRVLLRDPTPQELAGALRLVQANGAEITAESWSVLAHGLFATNEFLFVD